MAGDLPPRFPGRVDISPPVLIHMKVGLVGLFLSSTLCVLFNRSICSLFVPVVVGSSRDLCVGPIAARRSLRDHSSHSFTMRSSIVIQLSTLSVGVLGGVVPGPYYVNSSE